METAYQVNETNFATIIDSAQKTDEELVEIALKDAESFAHLIDRYEGKLLAYIKRVVSANDRDAEDILQEVFIRVYQNLNGFNPDYKFSSWIYRITYNQAITHYRKERRRPQILTSEDSEVIFEKMASDMDVQEEVYRKLEDEKIRGLLRKLEKDYREVLVLKFLEGKTYKEISYILRKPMGTVATLINRAKSKLVKLFAKNGVGVKTPFNRLR